MKILRYNSQAPLTAVVDLPASKSISNRLLIMRFLSDGDAAVDNLSTADDTQLLVKVLESFKAGKRMFNIENSGTVMRFVTALFATLPMEIELNGSARMHERPIKPLVESLESMGASIRYLDKEGFPPLFIKGSSLLSGGQTITLDPHLSSQFLSALMLIAPVISGGLRFRISSEQVSRPYIEMTLELMKAWGIAIEVKGSDIYIAQQEYSPCRMIVEADWSSAAFFYEWAALRPGSQLFFPHLQLNSLQGDAKTAELFLPLGIESIQENGGIKIINTGAKSKHVHVDFADYPDLALPFITSCAGLQLMGTFTGLNTLQYKESDRMLCLSQELKKVEMDLRDNGMGEWVLINSCDVNASRKFHQQEPFDPHFDHRLSMCLAPLVLKTKELKIRYPEVVSKSFPGYWEQLDKVIT
jgi:3-phosphoshikimate 1-carboxyvinyltransferase